MQSTNIGVPVQPQPQVQATIPVQPAQYSTENQMMAATANQEQLHKIETVLDNESFQILQQVSSIHAQSIVAMGIKLFAKTNLYKEFMLKEDYKTLDNTTEDLVEETNVQSAAVVGPKTTSSSTPSATAAGSTAAGFTAW